MDNKIKNKIYAFIDSQNLNLGTSKSFTKKSIKYNGWKLDFQKFNQYLKTKYNVHKTFLFIGYIEQNKNLYNNLERWGYTLIFKPTVIQHGETKGNTDSDLVLQSMIEYKNYSKAIIIAGDGDYLCLINYLDQKNKLFKIFIPNQYSYSSLLKKFSKYFVYVTNLQKSLEYKKKTGICVRSKP